MEDNKHTPYTPEDDKNTPPLLPTEPSPIPIDDDMTGTDMSSGDETQIKQHPDRNDNSASRYYCPMKCEGEKTYDRPGECPICGMHLVKMESFS